MDPFTGRTLSRYRVIERIGEGGMGVVYLSRDERLERNVALKILPPGALSDDAARKRFRREALALSRLNHPNIATVFDFDTQDGVDFLVMEHVAGQTIDQRLRSGPLDEDEIVRLGGELASGLAAAHAEGIVHRDLKPGNVRLTPDGRLKILDFGLAQLIRREAAADSLTVTAADEAAGTLPYMAPEQLRREPPDARSDLWAAGLILYELATGTRTFPETRSGPLIASILEQAPTPPTRVNPDVSPSLQAVILHCLEKDPGNRYQSANDLARDLRKIGTGSEVRIAKPKRRRRAVAAAAVIAASGVAGALLISGALRGIGGDDGPIRSLAVLPLEDLSRDRGDEYFADGMTDELIASVAQIGALKVISRTSVMTFKGSQATVPEIGRALHVDAVLEGTVLRSGGRIRITAQLIRAARDEHLWAQTYERDAEDVLALQNDVARAIAERIRVTLSPNERAQLQRSRRVDPEAHAAYLRGLYNWNKRTVASLDKAIDYFGQSIAIDPTYALPYAGLAASYAVLPAYDPLRGVDALRKSRAAALRAIELDSTLAEPHAVLAGTLSEDDFDQRGAEVEYKRAIALNPNYASVRQWYADFLACMGRHEEAIAQVKRAQELDPLSMIINTEAGAIHARARKYDLAIESLQNTVRMDPSFARARQTLGYVYGYAGRYLELTYELQAEDSLLGRKTPAEAAAWYGPLRQAFRDGGMEAYYRQLLKQQLALAKRQRVPAYRFAVSYARVGENDSAFAFLNRACDERDPLVLRIKCEPHFDRMRADPRYALLLKRLGLPPDR